MQIKLIYEWFLLIFIALCCAEAHPHGGVFLEDDVCLIQIGFYKAHFTIYQPKKTKHKQYCEDIPEVTESIFVMEFIHNGLREVPIDFRIIRDVLDLGPYFKEEDLKQISDIDHVTEFYRAPLIQQDGLLLALHEFEKEGNYIGIVTASVPDNIDPYTAVFPFRVGSQKWGYIPLFVALVIFIQLSYWLMNGGFARLREKINLSHHKD